ncbi:hypothetical protein [Geomobilimonas luticola]|uniref:GIY-YIG domain-containing protein n=1 Tax=Geomobilimonas luticola TaxID=1114878 RepID=A0ABS5SEA1_9BACT|nr:hypothetical protein [Geomobilimonas luticola]MBT0652347.1 hypothetical protein [Geomobilimonas luticola]
MDVNAKLHDLTLSDLESYADFLRNPKNLGGKCGVYIWGFRFFDPKKEVTSDFIPYYVGKHRSNIHRRIQEHVEGLRTGTHKILKKDLLLKKANWDDNWEHCRKTYFASQKSDHCAYLHVRDKDGKNAPKSILPPNKLVELTPHIETYIDNLYVTYIDVSWLKLSDKEQNAFVDCLERYVQQLIGDDCLACRSGVTLPPDFRHRIKTSKGTEHILKNYPL